jgi:hypothetical protein
MLLLYNKMYHGVEIAQLVQQRATSWTARVRFPEVQDFSLLHSLQTDSGAHPASCPVGTWDLFPRGVKRQGREADQLPPSSAEVKKIMLN